MSNYIQTVGTRLFRQHLEQYAPPDPLYEYYTDPKGKQRRKKRGVPPGISARDAKILKAVQRRARCLDKSFDVCGLRFGWTFIIGIVPGAGDAACALLGYGLVVRKARQADLPPWLVGKMMFNTTVSALGGLVPGFGDVFMAIYKANSRNAMLLEEFLRIRGEEYLKLLAEQEEIKHGNIVASSVSQKDMEQVKPGAGMEPGRNFTSFLSLGGKKQAKPMESSSGRGRFVENMNS